MPKSSGFPKSLLTDIKRVKGRLDTLEKKHNSLWKEFKTTSKAHHTMLEEQKKAMAQMSKKPTKAKRKPSEYNLFLKEKMASGMSMVDAVKLWKTRSTRPERPREEWQIPSITQ